VLLKCRTTEIDTANPGCHLFSLLSHLMRIHFHPLQTLHQVHQAQSQSNITLASGSNSAGCGPATSWPRLPSHILHSLTQVLLPCDDISVPDAQTSGLLTEKKFSVALVLCWRLTGPDIAHVNRGPCRERQERRRMGFAGKNH